MYGKDDEGQWYKIKEYHHSSREEKLQKTDVEYADDLEQFMEYTKSIQVIVDPSAASFIAELRKIKIKVKKANVRSHRSYIKDFSCEEDVSNELKEICEDITSITAAEQEQFLRDT